MGLILYIRRNRFMSQIQLINFGFYFFLILGEDKVHFNFSSFYKVDYFVLT